AQAPPGQLAGHLRTQDRAGAGGHRLEPDCRADLQPRPGLRPVARRLHGPRRAYTKGAAGGAAHRRGRWGGPWGSGGCRGGRVRGANRPRHGARTARSAAGRRGHEWPRLRQRLPAAGGRAACTGAAGRWFGWRQLTGAAALRNDLIVIVKLLTGERRRWAVVLPDV